MIILKKIFHLTVLIGEKGPYLYFMMILYWYYLSLTVFPNVISWYEFLGVLEKKKKHILGLLP